MTTNDIAPMTEQPPKSHRRWLRFSLRTLFLIFTGFALLFGWYFQIASIVKQRIAIRQQAKAGDGSRLELPLKFYNDYAMRLSPASEDYEKDFELFELLKKASSPPSASKDLPFLRIWLGDEAVVFIVAHIPQDHDLARLRFPEAYVYLMPPARKRTPDP